MQPATGTIGVREISTETSSPDNMSEFILLVVFQHGSTANTFECQADNHNVTFFPRLALYVTDSSVETHSIQKRQRSLLHSHFYRDCCGQSRSSKIL